MNMTSISTEIHIQTQTEDSQLARPITNRKCKRTNDHTDKKDKAPMAYFNARKTVHLY